jgi:hypothetical protein
MLRQAIPDLPWASKTDIPAFSNLQGFLNQYTLQQAANPTMETTFASIIQLAEYIAYECLSLLLVYFSNIMFI